jgi:hypothetical protein
MRYDITAEEFDKAVLIVIEQRAKAGWRVDRDDDGIKPAQRGVRFLHERSSSFGRAEVTRDHGYPEMPRSQGFKLRQ